MIQLQVSARYRNEKRKSTLRYKARNRKTSQNWPTLSFSTKASSEGHSQQEVTLQCQLLWAGSDLLIQLTGLLPCPDMVRSEPPVAAVGRSEPGASFSLAASPNAYSRLVSRTPHFQSWVHPYYRGKLGAERPHSLPSFLALFHRKPTHLPARGCWEI